MKSAGILVVVMLSIMFFSMANAGEVKYLAVNDTKLAYVEQGQGTPVVFVHGGLSDYRVWDFQIQFFAKNYRAIAYSRRNHFPYPVSADGTPDIAVDLHAEDLAAFIKNLGLVRPIVIGHSSGDGAESLKEYGRTFAPIANAFRNRDLDGGIRLFIGALGGSYDQLPEGQRRMMMDNVLPHVADAITPRPRPVFTCDLARQISAPMLIVNGSGSPAPFHRIADELARCAPNTERITIQDASHRVPSDQPEAFSEAALGFLANKP